MRKELALLLLALLTVPGSLLGQSLGEVAAQEKARREKEKAKEAQHKPKPTKAFTDDDLLPGAKRDPNEAPPPPVEPYVAPDPAPVNPEGEADSGPKAEWRQRAEVARQLVATAQQAVASIANDAERIRQDLNPMSLTYNPDDVNLTLRLQHELNETEKRLAAAQQQVEAAEKTYKAFEDEARRTGVPSSWLE